MLERTEVATRDVSDRRSGLARGYPARKGNGIFALNALLPDGREVILRAGIAPRWNTTRANRPENILQTGVADANANGLFRVWSMQFAGEGRWRWPDSFPLTPAAAAALAAFDPIEDDVLRGCAKKGMPWIMEQPFPMEIARQGDDVVLRLEENDVVRTVHMTEAAGHRPITERARLLGRALGERRPRRSDDRDRLPVPERKGRPAKRRDRARGAILPRRGWQPPELHADHYGSRHVYGSRDALEILGVDTGRRLKAVRMRGGIVVPATQGP